MAKTSIEWADYTFNPWWGCQKVSVGCTHCYAETLDHRWGGDHWGPAASRKILAEKNWREIALWNKAARRSGCRLRVFCGSMCDVFEDRPELTIIRRRLFKVMATNRWLTWLVLTKRNDNILPMIPGAWKRGFPPHIWIGTSVERQEEADVRLPVLLQVPARRFVSFEPLLGPLDISSYTKGIHWAIVGGESGSQGRPMHPDWIREIRTQCQSARIPFFFKQWGRFSPERQGEKEAVMSPIHNGSCYPLYDAGKKKAGRILDGELWGEIPAQLLQLNVNADKIIV